MKRWLFYISCDIFYYHFAPSLPCWVLFFHKANEAGGFAASPVTVLAYKVLVSVTRSTKNMGLLPLL